MQDKPGPIAVKAAEVALGFAAAGTKEAGGNNRGAQVERFLASVHLSPGDPWCAAFVRHCLGKAAGFLGTELPAGFPDSGYVPDYGNWAKSQGAWITAGQAAQGDHQPQRGDLICFYFEAKGRLAHIGIVTGTYPGGVTTVEGNTSDPAGVDRDGDGVYEKRRSPYVLGARGGFIRLGF